MINGRTAPTMGADMTARYLRQPVSRKVRVARALHISPAQADKKLYGEHAVNRECARILESDLEAGDTEAAAQFLAVIDAAAAPRQRLELGDALHRAECADALEQISDETFRDKLRRGTATVEDAREFIRKSATARGAAEIAEREVQAWIDEQEAKK